jgi:hypothetical protein
MAAAREPENQEKNLRDEQRDSSDQRHKTCALNPLPGLRRDYRPQSWKQHGSMPMAVWTSELAT